MNDNIPKYIPKDIKKALSRGGSRGGNAASAQLTPAQRKARARKAARARWNKKKD